MAAHRHWISGSHGQAEQLAEKGLNEADVEDLAEAGEAIVKRRTLIMANGWLILFLL
jgi:hypothetical protein